MEIWLDLYLKEKQLQHHHRRKQRGTRITVFQLERAPWLICAHWKGQYVFWPLWGADPLIFQKWCLDFTVTYLRKASDWAGTRVSVQDQCSHFRFEKKFRIKDNRLQLILQCYSDTAFQLFRKSIFSHWYKISIRGQRLSTQYWFESSLWIEPV